MDVLIFFVLVSGAFVFFCIWHNRTLRDDGMIGVSDLKDTDIKWEPTDMEIARFMDEYELSHPELEDED